MMSLSWKSWGIFMLGIASFSLPVGGWGEPQTTTSSVDTATAGNVDQGIAVLVSPSEISLEEGKSHEFSLVYKLNAIRDGRNLDFGCDDLWMECLGIQCDNTKGEMSLRLRVDAGRLAVGNHTSVVAVYEKNSDVMLAKTSLSLTVKAAAVKIQDSATTKASSIKKPVDVKKSAVAKTSRSGKEASKSAQKSETVKKSATSAKKDSAKAVQKPLPTVPSTPVPPKKRTFFGELLHTPGTD